MTKLFRLFDEAGNAAKFVSEDILDKTSGKTVAQHMADADIHPSKTTISQELAAAINGLKDGGDGSTLPADRNTLKKLADALTSTHSLVDDFINGEATDDGVMNRLVELVTQINANKDTIDTLLGDKIDVSAIVNDLTSGGTDKVLSAEQGKTLKALIDAIHVFENQETLDAISKNAATGNLVYNNKELTGETGIAYGTSMETAATYNGKLRIVVEDYVEPAA